MLNIESINRLIVVIYACLFRKYLIRQHIYKNDASILIFKEDICIIKISQHKNSLGNQSNKHDTSSKFEAVQCPNIKSQNRKVILGRFSQWQSSLWKAWILSFYKIAGTSDKVLEVKLVHTLFKDILFQSKIKSSQINARSCRQK